MGRRALRKIDPAVELAEHLRELPSLDPPPLDPQTLFPQAAPLELEMGSGKGLFLERASAERPGHNFLGVELARKYAHFAAARLARARRSNARMISGDGLRLFREFLPDGCAVAVHVYFPDPWWKKRHRKRRVLNAAFLYDVVRVLVVGGKLHFWTDVEEYFQSTVELIAAAAPLLAGPHAVAEPPTLHDLDFRTHFERRTRKAGEPVYRVEYERLVGTPIPPAPSLDDADDLPGDDTTGDDATGDDLQGDDLPGDDLQGND
ncbi:MAG: tRNA ((7)-)-methyltransferase [Planctomycetota bacterium]